MSNSAIIGQRVYNTYHHVEDESLPYELWDADAEKAAVVFLLTKHSVSCASSIYTDVVRAYNESNRRIGVSVRPFCPHKAESQVSRLARFMARFPKSTSAASMYRSLLDKGMEVS